MNGKSRVLLNACFLSLGVSLLIVFFSVRRQIENLAADVRVMSLSLSQIEEKQQFHDKQLKDAVTSLVGIELALSERPVALRSSAPVTIPEKLDDLKGRLVEQRQASAELREQLNALLAESRETLTRIRIYR